jgi:hypothetical protein
VSRHEQEYARLRGYLLGDLPPEELDELEGEMLERDDLFEAALAVESDLFDAYADGSLEGTARARLEERYGRSPRARDRMVFARALQGLRPVQARKRIPWLAVAAGLATVALCAGMWLELRRARGRLDALSVQTSELQRRASAAEERAEGYRRQLERQTPDPVPAPAEDRRILDVLEAPGPASRLAVLALLQGQQRSGPQPPALAIPPDATLVRLEIPCEGGPGTYNVALETAEGKPAWRASGLRARKSAGLPVASVLVPAAVLPPGHYVALLRRELPGGRSEDIGAFTFRVLPPR